MAGVDIPPRGGSSRVDGETVAADTPRPRSAPPVPSRPSPARPRPGRPLDQAVPDTAQHRARERRRAFARPGALVRHALDDRMTRSSLLVMATTVGNSLIGYVFWVVCARTYSPSQVGTVNAVIAAATIAATLADLGLRTMLMQHLPQERDQQSWSRRVSGALVLGTASSVVLGAAAVLLIPRINPDVSGFVGPTVAIVAVLFTVSTTLFIMLDGVSMAEHRSGQIAVRGAIYGAGKVVVLAVLLGFGLRSTQMMLIATLAGVAAGMIWGIARQVRRARPDWRFSPRGTVEGLREVRGALVGHYILNLGGWLPTFVLPLVVVARSTTQQNAYMTLTWLVGYSFFMVSPAVSSALFVQGRWAPDDLAAATRRAARLIAVLLVPAAIVVALLGHWILGIFGPGYAHFGYPLLLVLLASALPDAITNVRIGRLRALGHLVAGARMNMGMALTSIVLAWFLVPPMGIVGVGVAWLIAQSAGSVLGFIEDHWLSQPHRPAPA